MKDVITVKGYKGQFHTLGLGDFVADENGRGGRAVSITWDSQLEEFVVTAVPESGPSYELRGSQISYVAASNQAEV